MPNYRYGLSWPLPAMDTVSPAQAGFAAGLMAQRDAIERAMARWLAAHRWGTGLRWGLYTHPTPADGSLRLLWGGAASGPERILLNDARSLARAVLWGDSVVAHADENNQRYEFLVDEKLLAYVSLRQTRELAFQALAVLRIGFISDPIGPQADQVQAWMQEFRAFVRMAGLVISAAALGQPLLLQDSKLRCAHTPEKEPELESSVQPARAAGLAAGRNRGHPPSRPETGAVAPGDGARQSDVGPP